MSVSASEVDETTLSEEDDMSAAGHGVSVDLGLNVGVLLGVSLEPSNVDFDIEVTDVADNGIVPHDVEVVTGDDVSAASGGDEDLALRSSLLHVGDLVSSHRSLEGVDGVNLGDNDTGTV